MQNLSLGRIIPICSDDEVSVRLPQRLRSSCASTGENSCIELQNGNISMKLKREESKMNKQNWLFRMLTAKQGNQGHGATWQESELTKRGGIKINHESIKLCFGKCRIRHVFNWSRN